MGISRKDYLSRNNVFFAFWSKTHSLSCNSTLAISADLFSRDINNIVLNYLINNGYAQAAEKFSKEANIPVNLKDTTLAQRREIRSSILCGKVEDAIDKINDSFPTVRYLL